MILTILIFLSSQISKFLGNDTYERKIYKYSLIIPNFGYMGYSLAHGLYGQEGLLNMILFALPFSFYTYTFGFCMLTNKPKSLKLLINPVILSVLFGAVFGLFNTGIPVMLESFINKSANCMAPMSMLLAGITISEFDIKELLLDKNVYVISIIRLILIPFAVMITLKPVFNTNLVRTAVLFFSMPCGLNTIVFPKLIGENCKTGARLALISNIFALMSIPVILNFI